MAGHEGIAPPRLYAMGFPHNNCGGFCVKAGQAHFALLLRTMPERYAYHEAKENELRAELGWRQTILRDARRAMSAAIVAQKESLSLANASKLKDSSIPSTRLATKILEASPAVAKLVSDGEISLPEAARRANVAAVKPKPSKSAPKAKTMTPTEPAIITHTTSAAAPEPETAKNTPLTPIDFAKALDLLEKRTPEDADHKKFGVVSNSLTNRLMNFKKTTDVFFHG